jgi:hypothetical protein
VLPALIVAARRGPVPLGIWRRKQAALKWLHYLTRVNGCRRICGGSPGLGGAMNGHGVECRKRGFVSVWIGTFPSVEAAEAYFGIPDEIGVYLPPDGFLKDFGLDEFPAECLEVNFERTIPRPLRELLDDATFSRAFRDQAVLAASQQGISTAQGIALVYDFDYQAKPDWQRLVGPLTFIGTFVFVGMSGAEELKPRRDPRIEIREIVDNVL